MVIPIAITQFAQAVSPGPVPEVGEPAMLDQAIPRRLAWRILRFGTVGVTCYLVQLGLLDALRLVSPLYAAEAAAFLISAQLNFALSVLLTWGDRRGAERLGWQWIKFNANALVSVTLVNAGAFWVLVHTGFPLWLAMLFANAITACATFAVNHFIVFKHDRTSPMTSPGET